MSIARLIVFIIGAVLAITGLFLLINNLHDLYSVIIGAILIIIGVSLLIKRDISL